VSYNASPSASGNSVSAGTGSDVKTFLAAALLPFGGGMLVLAGYVLLDSFFGGLLGLVGAVLGVMWWRNVHGKVFPRELPTRSVVILAAVAVALVLLTFLLL
jgi:hypothetical protein